MEVRAAGTAPGRVLLCEPNAKRVVVLDDEGKEVWKKEGLGGPTDADFLPNGNILVSEQRAGRISEFDAEGKEAWKAEDLGAVLCAARLASGLTLAALETKIVEIGKDGKVVRDVASGFSSLRDLDVLPGGRLLVTDQKANRVAVLDAEGRVLWEKKDMKNPVDADWIPPAKNPPPPPAPVSPS